MSGGTPAWACTGRKRPVENGDVSTQDVLARYVSALAETLTLIVDFGDDELKIAWAPSEAKSGKQDHTNWSLHDF